MVPVIGAVAYIVAVIVPDWFGSRQGLQVQRSIAKAVNPEALCSQALRTRLECRHDLRAARLQAEACLAALAEEFEEAEAPFRGDSDPAPDGRGALYMFGKARAEFGLGQRRPAIDTLDGLPALARLQLRTRRGAHIECSHCWSNAPACRAQLSRVISHFPTPLGQARNAAGDAVELLIEIPNGLGHFQARPGSVTDAPLVHSGAPAAFVTHLRSAVNVIARLPRWSAVTLRYGLGDTPRKSFRYRCSISPSIIAPGSKGTRP